MEYILDSVSAYASAFEHAAGHQNATCVAGQGQQRYAEVRSDPARTATTAGEWAVVQEAVRQLKLGVELGRANHGDRAIADSMLRRAISGLSPASSFIVPIAWRGTPAGPGHAMVLQIEMELDGELTIRIFNLGGGVGR